MMQQTSFRALRTIVLVTAAALMPLGVWGCGQAPAEAEAAPHDTPGLEVGFTVFNTTAAPIDDVLVTGTPGTLRPLSFGHVEPGQRSGVRAKAVRLPQIVEVAWTDRTGARRFQRVNLDTTRAVEAVGKIELTIDPDARVAIKTRDREL